MLELRVRAWRIIGCALEPSIIANQTGGFVMSKRIGVPLAAIVLLLPLQLWHRRAGFIFSFLSLIVDNSLAQQIETKKHFNPLTEIISPEEINLSQTGQERPDQAKRVCTSRVHEADRLPDRTERICCRSHHSAGGDGADVPSNMQWQTVQEAKIKDRSERN